MNAVAIDGRPVDDSSRAELRFGAAIAVAFFVLFLGFAALVPMDSAGVARGQLVNSAGRQLVQHRDGGMVAAIKVRDGQHVERGQILIELAGDETLAQERALGGQLLNLELQRARLVAEQGGASTISWPADLGIDGLSAEEIARAKAQQSAQFQARRSLVNSQVGVLGEQARQAGQAATGYGSQMASSSEQERLIEEELDGLREAADKGFVSKNRIRALERQRAELHGNRGQYSAGVAQARSEAGTNRLRQIEAVRAFRERAADELRDVELSLAELTPKYRAARDQARKLQVRSPVSGTVLGLSVHTVGGVIAAGETLMEVVPRTTDVVVSARVSLDDANDMHPGQEAQLRFVTLHGRGLPIIDGTVRSVSGNSLADEKTGQAFYTAEVSAPQAELAKLSSAGEEISLRAGTPVDVLVPRKKRSLLAYLFEPLGDTLWKAMREH